MKTKKNEKLEAYLANLKEELYAKYREEYKWSKRDSQRAAKHYAECFHQAVAVLADYDDEDLNFEALSDGIWLLDEASNCSGPDELLPLLDEIDGNDEYESVNEMSDLVDIVVAHRRIGSDKLREALAIVKGTEPVTV